MKRLITIGFLGMLLCGGMTLSAMNPWELFFEGIERGDHDGFKKKYVSISKDGKELAFYTSEYLGEISDREKLACDSEHVLAFIRAYPDKDTIEIVSIPSNWIEDSEILRSFEVLSNLRKVTLANSTSGRSKSIGVGLRALPTHIRELDCMALAGDSNVLTVLDWHPGLEKLLLCNKGNDALLGCMPQNLTYLEIHCSDTPISSTGIKLLAKQCPFLEELLVIGLEVLLPTVSHPNCLVMLCRLTNLKILHLWDQNHARF